MLLFCCALRTPVYKATVIAIFSTIKKSITDIRNNSLTLFNPHSLQFLGKYGCFSEKSCPSLPGLFSSPRCGWSPRISASVGKGVIRSSIASSEHLLFQRLPGRCLLQNGSSIRRVSLRSQKTRCSALWMLRTPD